MIMDASFNIAMEPFRALVGDTLHTDQRTLGFSVQTALIGFGAVIGSWLPYVLTNWMGISNEAIGGSAPLNLVLSFIIGALVLIASILISIFSVRELACGMSTKPIEAKTAPSKKKGFRRPKRLHVLSL